MTIGDDCALNEGSLIQRHSMEDGTFKSGRIVLGNRCTLGVTAFVHYGVTMHDGSTLGADGFLIKGEDVPENAVYVGNPAREVSSPRDHRPTPSGPHRAATATARKPGVGRLCARGRAPCRHKAVRI